MNLSQLQSQMSQPDKQILQTEKSQIQNECPICSEPCLQLLINNALYHKHLDPQNNYYLRYIDAIMDDQLTQHTVKYKQLNMRDEDQQFMRRLYTLDEYNYKNKAISQYYKFHKDYPKLHQKQLTRIMDHYYDRKKEFQYKKIKRVLKQQQNISITTQKSSSVFSDIQDEEKKSHYSNILLDLTQNASVLNEQGNESQVWKVMCKKIDKAYQNKRFSPLQIRKKSTNQSHQNNDQTQTKDFIRYLKRQQDKKQKQQKYKNFVRSNKESRYNSIQHDKNQYSSGILNTQTLIKKLTKKPNQFIASKNPFFYDGKIFYGPNLSSKASLLSNKKQQKTKQQSNTPSHENFEQQNDESGLKKNKNYVSNNFKTAFKKKNLDKQYILNQGIGNNGSKNPTNKNKLQEKTTQQIYKNATNDLKYKKRSISYTSLSQTRANSNSKKNQLVQRKGSIVNLNALRQKDFETRNRVFSQSSKVKPQINKFFQKQDNVVNIRQKYPSNYENNVNLERAKSSHNFRTTHSTTKLDGPNNLIGQLQNRLNINSRQKISIPKQIIQDLKQKSMSGSKSRNELHRNGTSSQKKQLNRKPQRENDIQIISKQRHTNLFQEYFPSDKQERYLASNHASANTTDIDSLLNKKLRVRVQSTKLKPSKILI